MVVSAAETAVSAAETVISAAETAVSVRKGTKTNEYEKQCKSHAKVQFRTGRLLKTENIVQAMMLWYLFAASLVSNDVPLIQATQNPPTTATTATTTATMTTTTMPR